MDNIDLSYDGTVKEDYIEKGFGLGKSEMKTKFWGNEFKNSTRGGIDVKGGLEVD